MKNDSFSNASTSSNVVSTRRPSLDDDLETLNETPPLKPMDFSSSNELINPKKDNSFDSLKIVESNEE